MSPTGCFRHVSVGWPGSTPGGWHRLRGRCLSSQIDPAAPSADWVTQRPCGRRPASHTEYVQQRASRGRRPGSHNALVSAALGRLSTRQLPRRTGSHNALAGAAQPLTPIGTHSGILSSSAPLRLLRPRFGAQQPLSRGGWVQPKLGPKPYRKRSLCYRARAPAGPAAHSLAQRRDGQQLPRFIMACGLRSNSILHLASHVSPRSTTTS